MTTDTTARRYTVNAHTTGDGAAEVTANNAAIPFDRSWPNTEQPSLPGPGELLAAAFAACAIKNVERFSQILPFAYDSAEIDVELHRSEHPTTLRSHRLRAANRHQRTGRTSRPPLQESRQTRHRLQHPRRRLRHQRPNRNHAPAQRGRDDRHHRIGSSRPMSSSTVDVEAPVMERLSRLDRFLPVWILAAMALGLGLGRLIPDLNDTLDKVKIAAVSLPIAIGLLMMMYPVLAKVRYSKIDEVASDRKLMITSLVLNWVVGPALMFTLA